MNHCHNCLYHRAQRARDAAWHMAIFAIAGIAAAVTLAALGFI